MSLRIDDNIQLSCQFANNDIYNGLVPVRTFEFFMNGEKIEIDVLYKGNLGWHHRNKRYSFTLVLYQMGSITPWHCVDMFDKNTEFSILTTKYAGNGQWYFTKMQWNAAVFTSIRGTGMAPEEIPIITTTAKALEFVDKDGNVYGHAL